jgi:hypothetical protein
MTSAFSGARPRPEVLSRAGDVQGSPQLSGMGPVRAGASNTMVCWTLPPHTARAFCVPPVQWARPRLARALDPEPSSRCGIAEPRGWATIGGKESDAESLRSAIKIRAATMGGTDFVVANVGAVAYRTVRQVDDAALERVPDINLNACSVSRGDAFAVRAVPAFERDVEAPGGSDQPVFAADDRPVEAVSS